MNRPAAFEGAELAEPSDEAQAAETLRACTERGATVLPIGFGTKVHWAPPLAAPDVVLSTRALSGIVAHEPADGTITALAGTPIAELEAAAAQHGGTVVPLLAEPARATLGGVLSSGQDGLDRLRHGVPRDHVLGARLLLAGGTAVRSGGRLVKNVTGYDLHRLVCGAHGTLAVVVEATLRLFPAPRATAAVTATFKSVGAAVDAALEHTRAADLPRRVVVAPTGDHWRLTVELAAGEAEVDEQRRRLLAALPDAEAHDPAAVEPAPPAPSMATPAPGANLSGQPPSGQFPSVELLVDTRASRLVATLATVEAALADVGIAARTIELEPCVGRALLALGPGAECSEAAAALAPDRLPGVRVRLRGGRGMAAAERRAPDTSSPGTGGAAGAAALAARVRRALDPDGCLVARQA